MEAPSDEASGRTTLPWALVLLVLLLFGLWLRLHAFGFPPGFLFDEHHFVENARNYLSHRADWNDHPPLGKLLIAASILVLGDHSVAWRLPALLFGLVTLAAGGLATARLFRSRRAGLVALALLSADGFLIAYSRAGLLDGYLAGCLALALLLSTCRWNPGLALGAGALLGLAVNVKFSGVGVAAPLAVSLLFSSSSWGRRLGLGLVIGAAAAVVYVGVYAFGLSMAGQPAGARAVVSDTLRLLHHHAALTDMKNPSVSGWPSWVLPARAIVMSRVDSFGEVRVLTMLGNLVTWWSAVLLAAAAGWTVFALGARVVARESVEGEARLVTRFVVGHGKAVLLLGSAALAFLAPWVLTHRDSYLYHFLPSYEALVLLLGAFVAWLRGQAPRLALGFLCAVVLVASVYAPVWSSMPLPSAGVEGRLFLPGWR